MTLGHLMQHAQECRKVSKQKDIAESEEKEEEEEEESNEDNGENQEEMAFSSFRTDAINKVRESEGWEDQYNEFVKAGEEEDNARELADSQFEKRIIKTAERLYRKYLTNDLLLLNGDVHGDVRETLMDYWNKGYDARKASKLAVNYHLTKVRVLMEDEDEEESSTDEEVDEENSE